jgi:SNF family Na+-dependent transporter
MRARERERWGTRIGLVLALAGNAIGLGNFLRFPGLAAANGGGAFMIPYFTALLLIGIPLLWAECAIGRFGGRFGHGHTAGMFHEMWPSPLAKYVGMLGIFIPFTVGLYYLPLASWCLGFAWFSLTGAYEGLTTRAELGSFLAAYQGWEQNQHFHSRAPMLLFYLLSLAITLLTLAGGIARGIERLAKVALPLLFAIGILLAIRVLTLDPPPGAGPDQSVSAGMGFVWNSDLSALWEPRVWLAAAGQVFFTLSVGWGIVHTYMSYVGPDEDVALAGLSAATYNEFAEVVLGGTIAITAAVVFFGITATREIAQSTFDLGFQSMALIFQTLPGGRLLGSLWFLLLFFAGLTSAVAIVQPAVSLLEEGFGATRSRAVAVAGSVLVVLTAPVLWCNGVLGELDFWAGTYALLVFGLLEALIVGWSFGIDRTFQELTHGARIRVPPLLKPVLRYVTPLFLAAVLLAFSYLELPRMLRRGTPEIWIARAMMVGVLVALVLGVRSALGERQAERAG